MEVYNTEYVMCQWRCGGGGKVNEVGRVGEEGWDMPISVVHVLTCNKNLIS